MEHRPSTKKPNGPLMQGLLSRRIMGGNMKSKKKWYVLTGRRLQSFKSEQDFTAGHVFVDCLDLMDLQTARALTSQGHSKNSFEIVSRNKSIVFKAPSLEESNQWLTALRQVMMLRFSESADLPEEAAETKKIEEELQRRRSTFKFFRNSRSSSSKDLEEDAVNSFGFLEQQEEEEEEEVFHTDEKQEADEPSVHVRPVSGSSGVDSVSVEETPDDVITAPNTHSEDEGCISEVAEEEEDGNQEPFYENFRTSEAPRTRKPTPAIDELKEMVRYDEKMRSKETDGETGSPLKGIEELRQLLATMP